MIRSRKPKQSIPPWQEIRDLCRVIDHELRPYECDQCGGHGSTEAPRYLKGSHVRAHVVCRICGGTGRITEKATSVSGDERRSYGAAFLRRRLADAAERILGDVEWDAEE